MIDILERLVDLHKRAVAEHGHRDVTVAIVQQSISEIISLRGQVRTMDALLCRQLRALKRLKKRGTTQLPKSGVLS